MSDFNDSIPEVRWYVAHTYSGYENKVKTNLEKIVENRGLQHLIKDVRVPVEVTVENEGEEDEATVPVRLFANQFYLKGEVLVELELEDAVEDFVCQGELSSGEEYTEDDKPFVALKVPATTASAESPALVGYANIAELQEAQFDVAYVVKPLYKFTHSGAVAVDFRNCPALQVAEVL